MENERETEYQILCLSCHVTDPVYMFTENSILLCSYCLTPSCSELPFGARGLLASASHTFLCWCLCSLNVLFLQFLILFVCAGMGFSLSVSYMFSDFFLPQCGSGRTGPSRTRTRWQAGGDFLKEIYDGFSFPVVELTTFSPIHFGSVGIWPWGADKCVFIIVNLCLLQCQKEKKKLLKRGMTLSGGSIPDDGPSWPSHLISGWSNIKSCPFRGWVFTALHCTPSSSAWLLPQASNTLKFIYLCHHKS